MQTRARNVGGDLELTSEPDEGTTILVWMPHVREHHTQEED
jgi:signal transduction histidine kinase